MQLIVEDDYNLHEIPRTENQQPLLISASINIRNILEVDEKDQIVSMETTLRLYWKDPRIKPKYEALSSYDSRGNYTNLHSSLANTIWMPDIFLDHAKTIRTPTFFSKPASLRVYNDSTIRYSARINFDVACNMDFRNYPADDQSCELKFQSFGLQRSQVHFTWIPNSINVNEHIYLSQFVFRIHAMDSYSTDYYDISYPGLKLQLHLTREIGYHIVQTYIPSTLFLVLGWMGLFINPDSIPGRVGMGTTTLLTQTSMFSSTRAHVPKVSYVTYLDVWMLFCMFFVFSTMVEFISILILIRQKRFKLAKKVQRLTRLTLPCIFMLFNLAYWPNVMYERWTGNHWAHNHIK
ncbi:glycine receptor subunit alpha-4 [Eurytemora carolleeae]|uniref:glycine receptor subunit alpha-4 n=1 Tax=Eurytemora carolleeae TaxID=1294199 RepID=UPI000C78AC6D|nr:glycine receptor subunit alpha-4 [Eurytemora carolleeae]|eukprot:XP_023323536.1 glycine receptor subunit alpha-4-like [Eurytemora affinis]